MEVCNLTKSISNELSDKNCVRDGTKNSTYYIKNHVLRYMEVHKMSQDEFAEYAGISSHTLHSIIYKGLDDCKLSTAVAIAKAIGIGVDELANTGALSPFSLESLQIVRSLPKHTVELIRRYILWQKAKYEKFKNYHGKIIEVMDLDFVDNHLMTTDHFEKVDISEFSPNVKAIVFRGMRIPCEDYIQYYSEGDILLLAGDRQPRARERCLILYYGRVFIVQRDKKNGVLGYRGIRDEEAFIPETDIDHYFGYVVDVKHEL